MGRSAPYPNPQQPDIRREWGEVVQDAVKTRHGGPTDGKGNTGPFPENRSGHHPEKEQDKPV